MIEGIRYNIRHSILASLTISATGLFLQAGMILRSAVEDILVLFDVVKNNVPVETIRKDRYNARSVVTRIKHDLPSDIIQWYGYLSSNYTHFNVVHTSGYMPSKCHADNFASVSTFQNVLMVITAYHIVLEYIYFDNISDKVFWKEINGKKEAELYNERMTAWTDMFRKEILAEFNPDERKDGLIYSSEGYQFKR